MVKLTDQALDRAIKVYKNYPVKEKNEEDLRYQMACAIRAALNEVETVEKLDFSVNNFSLDEWE